MPSPQTTSPPELLLDNRLCFAMYSTSLAMTKLYKPLLAELGLTYPQYLVLLVLWEADDISVSALGERLYLDSGTLTPLLKRMETAGWLKRTRASDDERRVHVTLTPAGLALRDRAAKIPQCLMQATQCAVPELVTLTQQLQSVRARISF